LGEERGTEAEVNEAGAGDFGRQADVLKLQSSNEVGGEGTGVFAQAFRVRHGDIGLVVGVAWVGGFEHGVKRRRAGDDHRQGRSETGTKESFNGNEHGKPLAAK